MQADPPAPPGRVCVLFCVFDLTRPSVAPLYAMWVVKSLHQVIGFLGREVDAIPGETTVISRREVIAQQQTGPRVLGVPRYRVDEFVNRQTAALMQYQKVLD